MKNPFAKFKKLYLAEKYDEALKEVAMLEKEYSLPPNLLIIKAACIFLGSGTTAYSLDDAETAYKRALEIDPENVEALIEAGYHYLNVLDKREIAKHYFDKAISISRTRNSDAIIGMAECISETSPKKALQFLNKTVSKAVDLKMIEKTIRDIKKKM